MCYVVYKYICLLFNLTTWYIFLSIQNMHGASIIVIIITE